MSRHRTVGPLTGTVAGLTLVLAPASFFAPLVTDPWEVDLLRFTGLVAIGVALLWPWAMAQDQHVARRMRRWVGAVTVAVVLYPLRAHSLFLILTFVLLVGAGLNIAMERAERSSQALGRRLGLGKGRR